MSKILIFPTDTVYGLGAPMNDPLSIQKIYDIKGRSDVKPMAILIQDISEIEAYADISIEARKLAQAFWPGALTLILKSTPIYEKLTGEKTIGVRVPNHPTALQLIAKYGPLKTTSVNLSGEPPLNEYETIQIKFASLVDEIYPNKFKMSQLSSTVIDLSHETIRLIRMGDISIEKIHQVLNR